MGANYLYRFKRRDGTILSLHGRELTESIPYRRSRHIIFPSRRQRVDEVFKVYQDFESKHAVYVTDRKLAKKVARYYSIIEGKGPVLVTLGRKIDGKRKIRFEKYH